MNELPGNPTYPPGCLPSDIDQAPRLREVPEVMSEAEHYAHW